MTTTNQTIEELRRISEAPSTALHPVNTSRALLKHAASELESLQRDKEELQQEQVAIRTAIVNYENPTGDTSDLIDLVMTLLDHHKQKEVMVEQLQQQLAQLQKDKERLDSVLPTLKKYNLGTREEIGQATKEVRAWLDAAISANQEKK